MRASVFMNTRYTRNCTLTELQCNRRALPYNKSTNNLQLAKQTKKKQNTWKRYAHILYEKKKEKRGTKMKWERGGQKTLYDQNEFRSSFTYSSAV